MHPLYTCTHVQCTLYTFSLKTNIHGHNNKNKVLAKSPIRYRHRYSITSTAADLLPKLSGTCKQQQCSRYSCYVAGSHHRVSLQEAKKMLDGSIVQVCDISHKGAEKENSDEKS